MKKLTALATGLLLTLTLSSCSSEKEEVNEGGGFGGALTQELPKPSPTRAEPSGEPAGGIAAVRTFDIPTYVLNGGQEFPELETVSGELLHDRECFILKTPDERVALVFPNARGVEDDSGTLFVEWADAGSPLRADSEVSLQGFYMDPIVDSWEETGWSSLCTDSEVTSLFKVHSMGETND